MSSHKIEVSIPVVRDSRTFEQRREAMLTNLERDFDRPEYSTIRSGGSDTTAPSFTSDSVTGGTRSTLRNEWGGEINRWVNESRRRWDEDITRMRNDMFTLEPIDRFGRDDWGKMGSLGDFSKDADASSLMAKMEREMESMRQQMHTMSPFSTSKIGASGPTGPGVQSTMSCLTKSSRTTTTGSGDPRSTVTHSDVKESSKHSRTVNGKTTGTSSQSSMSSTLTGAEQQKAIQDADFQRSLQPKSGGMINVLKDAYEIGDDGQLHFKVRFDAKDFAPEDIDVTTVENRLTVFAKSDTPTSKKEFCRTIELPRSIDHERFQCHLTEDGVLILDAPVNAPDYKSITFNQDHQLGIRPKSEAEITSSTNSGRSVALRSTGVSGTTILHEGATGRRLHLEVPVDPEYESDDLTVTMDGNRIVVSGRKSESQSSRAHCSSSSKEFTKSYDIPESVDPLAVTAQIMRGMLLIEAPLNSK